MDDSNTSNISKTERRVPLGINKFGSNDRHQFGQAIRLAMACIEGSRDPTPSKALPADASSIGLRLKTLSQDITSYHADLVELLVRFDDLDGWKVSGSKHCAAWMNVELGISTKLGWEYLRVGRRLRLLATTTALFRAGKLSWSKVRLISRVADEENEKTICHAALDAPVSDVERLCCGYRWNENDDANGENERAIHQQESRALTWSEASSGCTRIQLVLPPEIAQVFLNSVEYSMNQLDDSGSTVSQRRADAAVLIAEASLQCAGQDIATADRYQVIVSVDHSELKTQGADSYSVDNEIPAKRPALRGAGFIGRETARRIACDCSVSTQSKSGDETLDIGRKSRIWPNAMARAIKDRDQHCQFPGCTQSQHLQIHHIKHWADGGSSCIDNGVSICSFHHTLVHEGGYTIQRVERSVQRLNEQFMQQQHTYDHSMFDFEKNLRNDSASFDKVRTLLPTRFRFRVVDCEGRDIRKHSNGQVDVKNKTELESIDATNNDSRTCSHSSILHSENSSDESTRVDWPNLIDEANDFGSPSAGVAEPSAKYCFNTRHTMASQEYRSMLH